MVWNIYFQSAALTIALVIAGMCMGQKRLNFSAEKAFTKLLFHVIASIVLDIASIFAINYRESLGDTVVQVVCKAYMFSIAVVACMAAWFAAKEIRYSFKKGWVYATAYPLIIEFIVLCIFPVGIYVDEKSIYTYGIPAYVTYAICGIYILSNAVMVYALKSKINIKRRYSIHFWMIAWLIVAAIQFVYSELLLVSFAMALGCMYMYCKLENPEYHLDFATNVFNRKGFEMIMSEHIKHGASRTLISFTIGDMNVVNEVFGTHAVEKVILAIAQFAEKIPHTTLFRMEDELFCVSMENSEEAEIVLETLLRRFENSWEIDGASIEIRASFSFIYDVSKFNYVDELEEVVHYFALESTRRSLGEVLYVTDDEMKKRQRNIAMHNAIDWAIKNDTIEVYYQPIYNIKEGKFSSMEALIRIRNDKGEMLPPQEFIEFSEKNGMIIKLGEIVFRKTCEFIQRKHIEKYGIEYVEVNLSAVQCVQENLARTLKDIMGEYQIPPYMINFEVTETAELLSRRMIDKNMRELLAYGSTFSLDDYGSGYSNLTYVVNLPIKIIKIDKLITDSFFTSEKVRIAAEYTIEMAHKLGLEVVVEGVDSEEKFLAFKNLNVEFIQGFYFSRPLPKDQVLNFIQEWL